jgi:hypothetical protein
MRNDAVFKRLLVSFLQSALDLPPEDYAEVKSLPRIFQRPEKGTICHHYCLVLNYCRLSSCTLAIS